MDSHQKLDSTTDVILEDVVDQLCTNVLPFYRINGELMSVFKYNDESNTTLDRLDETEIPDTRSTSFWVKPNIIQSFFGICFTNVV